MTDIGLHQRSTIAGNSYRGQVGNHQNVNSHSQFSNNLMIPSVGGGGLKVGSGPNMFQGHQQMVPGMGFQTGAIAAESSTNSIHQINNSSNSHQQYNPPWSSGSVGSSGEYPLY